MPDATTMTRWLPLAAGLNIRDIGGLACRDGGRTRFGALIRSGSLRFLTPSDVEALVYTFDVRRVIDLRSEREVQRDGVGPLASAGIRTDHLPLTDNDRTLPTGARTSGADALGARTSGADAFGARTSGADAFGAGAAYRGYVDDHGHNIVAAAGVLAQRAAGTVIVHSAAGADRTGMVVAILLDAVGVERFAILGDYAASNEVIGPVLRMLAGASGDDNGPERQGRAAEPTRPAAIRRLLEWLDAEHGGAASWLLAGGLRRGELEDLRAHLTRAPAVPRAAMLS